MWPDGLRKLGYAAIAYELSFAVAFWFHRINEEMALGTQPAHFYPRRSQVAPT